MSRRVAFVALASAVVASAGCVSGPIAGPSSSGSASPAPGASSSGVPASAPAAAAVPATAEATPASATPTPSPTPTAAPTATPTPTATAPRVPSPPFAGFFALGGVISGPGEFRVGTSDWYIELPAGMQLRWDFVSPPAEDGEVRWGWSDIASGSQIIVRARDVTDVARLLSGDAGARARADRNFDALMDSVNRQTPQ